LLTIAGFQVPVIELLDVVGKTGRVEPEHIGAISVKVGVIVGFTVTLIVVPIAHSPTLGVKLYIPEVVLLTITGFQVPVIPLFDVRGKVGLVVPEHIGAMAVKLGVRIGLTVTFNVAVVAH
jgi:hypothetical protein